MGPVVSIITPCLNASSVIGRCLESTIRSTSGTLEPFRSLEHLIIDGGSTDGTAQIAEAFAKDHPHVRVISEPDSGQSDAMNKGIQLAQGNILGFLNADDEYLPGAIQEALDILSKMPKPSFVCGNCRVDDAGGKIIHVNKPKRLSLAHLLAGAEPPWNPAAYFYHRSLHDLIGEYDVDDHYTMDLDFILRAAARIRLHYVDRDWGVFRWAAGAKTFEQHQSGLLERRKQIVYQRHLQRASPMTKVKVRLLRICHRWRKRVGRLT